jgi:hypothetical protein
MNAELPLNPSDIIAVRDFLHGDPPQIHASNANCLASFTDPRRPSF